MTKGIFLLFFISFSVNAAELLKEIPKQYIGTWSSDLSQCNKDHIYNLEIHKRNLVFWESGGPVIAAVTHNNELALILELSGEGEEWISFLHFKLISNKMLKDITDPYSKDQLVRYKCPVKSPNKALKQGASHGTRKSIAPLS